MIPVLTPVAELIPADYNPRVTDPERLARLAASISKLGWVLPIYATVSGEILSGHQRTLCARNLGYTHVPVIRLPDMEEPRRRALNLLFNRSTNDMEALTDTKELAHQLLMSDLTARCEKLPSRMNHFPCMAAEQLPIDRFLKANADRMSNYAMSVASAIYKEFDVLMPIIVDEQDRVVNGIGRLELIASLGETTAEFVRISTTEAEFASVCLNLISMDFALSEHYADFLRSNAFRRIAQDFNSQKKTLKTKGRMCLGWAFLWPFGDNVNGDDFDVYSQSVGAAWRKRFGASIVDFGGGRGNDTAVLRDIGVRVSFFEPFFTHPDRDEVDIDGSRRVADAFLEDVASGRQYSSLFLAAVLNSVPFMEDRRKIVTILSALCGRLSTLYAITHGETSGAIQGVITGRLGSGVSPTKFLLDYEPNTTIAELSIRPNVQKYHTREELERLFCEFFDQVTIGVVHGSEYTVTARFPKPVDPVKLRAALEFEFNVPYDGGQRMDRHNQAIAAFSKRLKISL